MRSNIPQKPVSRSLSHLDPRLWNVAASMAYTESERISLRNRLVKARHHLGGNDSELIRRAKHHFRQAFKNGIVPLRHSADVTRVTPVNDRWFRNFIGDPEFAYSTDRTLKVLQYFDVAGQILEIIEMGIGASSKFSELSLRPFLPKTFLADDNATDVISNCSGTYELSLEQPEAGQYRSKLDISPIQSSPFGRLRLTTLVEEHDGKKSGWVEGVWTGFCAFPILRDRHQRDVRQFQAILRNYHSNTIGSLHARDAIDFFFSRTNGVLTYPTHESVVHVQSERE